MKQLCQSCYKNLSVGTRFQIYEFINARKNACVSEITKYVGLKQPTVSYHLKEMENSGLVMRVPDGRNMYFKVNKRCPHDGKPCAINH